MFTVPKTEIATHWWAYSGVVEERTGECPDAENYFVDFAYAASAAFEMKREQLQRELARIELRASAYVLSVYRIRSLWNSKVRESLKRYEQELAKAKHAASNIPQVKVNSLPDEIPVLGQRLALGTTVYEVDSYALTLRIAEIVEERIDYYTFHPEGGCSNLLSKQSTIR